MNLGGLAPDKAPPIEAPLLLFRLMPWFLGLAGLLLAWQGDQVVLSRWTPAALAVTHFLVLGALAPVMCGALLQIAPVLLGAPYPRARLIARLTAAGLAAGGLLVGSGLLFGRPLLLVGGGGCAAVGLLSFLAGSWLALRHGNGRSAVLLATRLATLSLAVTVSLGLLLALARQGGFGLAIDPRWVDLHAAWGLAGWVGLLLAGTVSELIPMFYMAPAATPWSRRPLSFVVAGLLSLLTVLVVLPLPSGGAMTTVFGLLFALYALANLLALRQEQRRQRPRRDANLWLWQAGHLLLLAAFSAWLAGVTASGIGALLLGGVLCLVVGSLLKIVPFLNWLDLQQRRIARRATHVRLPRLHALLPERFAQAIAATLAAAVMAVGLGSAMPLLARVGGVLLAVCGVLLGVALARAARIRRAVLREIAQAG